MGQVLCFLPSLWASSASPRPRGRVPALQKPQRHILYTFIQAHRLYSVENSPVVQRLGLYTSTAEGACLSPGGNKIPQPPPPNHPLVNVSL